jgi:hypothetical protein
MTQLLLPFNSPSVIQINPRISVWEIEDRSTYFLGEFPSIHIEWMINACFG